MAANAFLNFLTVLLQQTPDDMEIMRYDGPSTPQIDEIQRGLKGLARRVLEAEVAAAAAPAAASEANPPPTPTASGSMLWNFLGRGNDSGESVPPRAQLAEVTRVCKAVASGDLSQRVTSDAQGAGMGPLKDSVNAMVDKLQLYAEGVKSVSREVETHGNLRAAAPTSGLRGDWLEATQAVNVMVRDLGQHLELFTDISRGVARGELSRRTAGLPGAGDGLNNARLALNGTVSALQRLTGEISRVADLAAAGSFSGSVDAQGLDGEWKNMAHDINYMLSTVSSNMSSISAAANAAANGEMGYPLPHGMQGEFGSLKNALEYLCSRHDSHQDRY